jgi:NAD(P)-dependent dehydrogenase (short-subunit alcohol dehydrogenase family)
MKSLKELMDLTGRVALITGAAGHLGAAASEALAELGAAIVVLDMNEEACQRVAQSIQTDFRVETFPLAVDLADDEAVRAVSGTVVRQFGRLDILINCAAFVGTSELNGWAVPFAEQRLDAWRAAVNVNLTSPFNLTQSCAPALKESGHGSIVNICSIYGLVGPDLRLYEGTRLNNPAAYAASKGGLLQLTRWLATVLAPEIRVNAVTPGGVWRNQAPEFHERYIERTPLKRMATEEDFKGAIAYLSSDLAAYVTGHNLVLDGGWTIW